MGGKESKPSCISYEDAIKRVSELELRRIREAFKKSAGPGGTFISQSAFQQDVLCEGVPSIVADWLYAACGGTSKGIAYKDLFCALVLLTRGKEEEKIRFLWNLYCNDSGTYILKLDYTKILTLESSLNSPDINDIRNLANTSLIQSLFAQSDRLNYEQFRDWIISHKNSTILAKWLLSSDACINLTSELETPTFYQSLAGVTHLEEQDIGDLEKEFWRLKNSSPTGQLDLESLGPLISPPIPKAALSGLFYAFDENRDGHIDFKELCCGVSAACRGPNVERSKFCFKVFDVDRDGVLNQSEITQMIDILIFVAKESANSNNYRTITTNHVINDLLRFSRKNDHLASESIPVENLCNENEEFLEFSLTQEDFMMWSVQSALNLVQPFLDLSFEVCHIVFGLRPQCKHMESDIVKGWLSREERRGYKIGQFWYLISKEWWNAWQSYTQNYAISCAYCKHPAHSNGSKSASGVDEAMVCDESFTSNSSESMGDLLATAETSSLGSCSSGISCGRQLLRPGPIDNTNLITPNIFKGIRTLTGEGGHLKKDTPLVQHIDFELVPKSLWKALSRWYGDILSLPRQVIQPPNSPDVELELYPLNLRILLHQNVPAVNQTISTWGVVSGGYGSITPSGSYTTISSVPNALQPPKRYLAYTAAFSRLATVKQIDEFLCEQLKLKQEDIRLWHISNLGLSSSDDVPILLEEENMTLKDLMIRDKDQILLEIRNKDLTWPEELGSLSLSQSAFQEKRPRSVSIQSVHAPGATGLHNLGNTCFMNAALQVLFNTQPLTQYFTKSMHLFELNTTNKLGTKGQLATKYGELLKEIWTANTRSVAPLKLRFCVTKHAPQFAGGGQHDSQELLEWLLDALHEDLNRVTEKPYTELKDSDGRPDEVVAAEAWAQHHARNQSIVIDLFYGQLKSKVSCLCCGRESVRFDPFSLLSLPLPVENFTYFEILVILLDGSVPTKYGLRLNSDLKYSDLKKKLASLCNVNPGLMLICELSHSQIKCMFSDDQKIKSSNATELYVYQLPESDDSRSRTSSILGVNIEKGLKDIQRSPELPNRTQPINLQNSKQIFDKIPDDGNQQQFDVINDNIASGRRTSKVSRCFGNTMCMPQTLLCFKQSAEISTSPENTFVNIHRKRISTTNLLNDNTQSYNNSSDEASINEQKTSQCNALDEDVFTNNHDDSVAIRSDCPCRSISDSCEDEDNTSIPFDGNFRRKSNLSRTSQNCRIGRYLIAVHRKLTRQDTYFLSYHKTRPSLFGVPLLIPCYENSTNKDLYCAVWMQVSRLLSPLPLAPDQSNHAADCDDSLGYDFPFTLRAVASDGRICALCPWSNFCRGCEIPCNDDLLLQGQLISGSASSSNASTPKLSTRFSSLPNLDSTKSPNSTKSNVDFSAIYIAIDWDPTALHLRYQSTREKIWNEHESVEICRRQQIEPVDLNHCLRAFTSEEKLEQWYYCSHCKGKKEATKKLQIWRLPPILIIHLKRFNCVNGKWVKSQKVVNFPFQNFDPTPYLASVPQETILRHKELLDIKKQNSKNICNESCLDYSDENIGVIREPKISEEAGEQDDDIKENLDIDTINNSLNAIDIVGQKSDDCSNQSSEIERSVACRKLPNSTIERRRRLISTSLMKTPVIDGHFKDFQHHKLKSGVDNFDLKYNLYAVVSHSGMLNGGHYVSYTANPNGSWYCYNDSSCREIPNRPNIDPSSAYLLFYERQGLDYEPYLPNVEGRTLPNGTAVEVDETDGDLRKMCVLS